MPSNAELIKKAEELAAQLETTVETKDMNSDKLAELVKGLEAQVAEKAAQAEKDKAAAASKAKAKGKKAKPKKPPFYVAPGKSLTSKKGILSGDNEAEVKAEYFAGGKEALDAFVESGHVLKG